MQGRQLHLALREFAQEAGPVLARAVDAGYEVNYEIVPEGGRGSKLALYCYRALIGEFIDAHSHELRALDTFLPALHALIALDGLAGYLDAHNVSRGGTAARELAEATLWHFTVRVFEGSEPRFHMTPERFEPAYRDLERLAVDGRTETVVLALLRGASAQSLEIPIGEGAILAAPDALEDMPPDPTWIRRRSPALVVALAPGDGEGALTRAVERLGDLQTAFRLYAGGISLAPLAWVRGDGTPWRPVPLGPGGRSDAGLVIAPDQEDELRAFLSLVIRRLPRTPAIGWALERFELGCERADELSGLTDHLLALRALLEPEGARSGRLAGRLAVLCGAAGDRDGLTERVAHAISLEQAVISGLTQLPHGAGELANEIESHLRTLLRDVVCGNRALPLDTQADELLVAAIEPEPESVPVAVAAAVEPEPEPEPVAVAAHDMYDDLEVWGEPAPFQPELFSM